jgi:hydroxypyruvate isomerase
MRYAPNVSILFQEHPYAERFAAARAAGFDAVETWWPRDQDLDEIASAIADSGVDIALMNVDAGDMAAGDRGLLADPRREGELRDGLPVAIELARRIGARRLNALVGLALPEMERADQLALVTENLRRVAAAAAPHGLEVLIEAVNTIENGPYLIATTADADALRRRVERSNVRLQYDAYHMQRMEGNLVATIERYLGAIAHVQIADSPGRNQPGTGEIAYPYVLGCLDALGYDGYVGLEYRAPHGDTLASLEWLPRRQRSSRATGSIRGRR